MGDEQPSGPAEEAAAPQLPRQDPHVERLRPDPSQPPQRVIVLRGLLGYSDREGYQRLYFTRELDYYAEFRLEDVVHTEPIPADQPPLMGLDGTAVSIKRDAPIEYTRIRTGQPLDEFDLDIRLGPRATPAAIHPLTATQSCFCPPETQTCATCAGTCTCHTACGTCDTCNTCETRCNQGTCNTCETQCNQYTCNQYTCYNTCNQQTCPAVCTPAGHETQVTCPPCLS